MHCREQAAAAHDGDEAEGGGGWLGRGWTCFVLLGYAAGLVLPIQASIEMNVSIQKVLTPAQRSSLLAADAFLEPVEEVFSFLEDTMTVRIGCALGT